MNLVTLSTDFILIYILSLELGEYMNQLIILL